MLSPYAKYGSAVFDDNLEYLSKPGFLHSSVIDRTL